MAALTDETVRELRTEMRDTGPQPVVPYHMLKRMWARGGGDYDTTLAMYARQMSLYHAQCGNKDAAIEYRKLADELGQSSGLALGKLSVGVLSLNLDYPNDDDTSADRFNW